MPRLPHLAPVALTVICAVICACAPDYEAARTTPAPLRYDLAGLTSCARLSALASYQGSCNDGHACAWAPELSDGVCAPGCDTHDDCPDGTLCRATDDGAGWSRSWCAPVVREAR